LILRIPRSAVCAVATAARVWITRCAFRSMDCARSRFLPRSALLWRQPWRHLGYPSRYPAPATHLQAVTFPLYLPCYLPATTTELIYLPLRVPPQWPTTTALYRTVALLPTLDTFAHTCLRLHLHRLPPTPAALPACRTTYHDGQTATRFTHYTAPTTHLTRAIPLTVVEDRQPPHQGRGA